MGGASVTHGERRGACRVLMGKARDHVENLGLYGSIFLLLFRVSDTSALTLNNT
jgi:hypothetical protein